MSAMILRLGDVGDDLADAIHVAKRLSMIEAGPLHAEQNVVGFRNFGIAQNLVLNGFLVTDEEALIGECIISGVEVPCVVSPCPQDA